MEEEVRWSYWNGKEWYFRRKEQVRVISRQKYGEQAQELWGCPFGQCVKVNKPRRQPEE